MALQPVDELKERDAELRKLAAQLTGLEAYEDRSRTAGRGLQAELIDYHAQYRPVEKADAVFDSVQDA